MRIFIAFFISLSIYLLLIWLYITKLSTIKTLHKKRNEHVIKIDIRNIEIPKKIESPIVKKIVKAEALAPIPSKPKPKKVEKKKRIIKKKVVKKKTIKKRVIKKAQVKKPIKKTIVKKTPKIETYIAPPPVEEELIYIEEPLLMESFEVIEEPIVSQKSISHPNDDLSSFLATPASSATASTKSYPSSKIKKLYGSSFHSFTPTQKRFIEDNLETIQQITQSTLTRRGYPEGAGRTRQEGTNVVSFNLHPNGNISNLRLKQRIGYRSLDDNTLELIRTAYKDYPYPSTTTKIVFYVTYSVYGY